MRAQAPLAILLSLLASAASTAQPVKFESVVINEGNSQYEIGPYDVGRNFAQVRLNFSGPDRLVCDSARVERVGAEFGVFMTVVGSGTGASCETVQNALLGELPAGMYSLLTTLVRPEGSGVAQVRSTFEVTARGLLCNLTPDSTLLELALANPDASGFIARFNQDAELRHSLADIELRSWVSRSGISIISADYPPLSDAQRVLAALRSSGQFIGVAHFGEFGYGCLVPCTPDVDRTAVEFHHAGFDRYFFTDEPGEIAKLDSAATSGGWARTGESWQVVNRPQSRIAVPGKVQQVYRFWGADVQGTPSHFFTVDRQECAQLRDGNKTGWTYEGAPFWSHLPEGGTCSAGIPLYRLYNNAKGGAPSHRFATRLAVVETMNAAGWTTEGVAMCVAGK